MQTKKQENEIFIEKSKPLFTITRENISNAEFEILDAYLEKLNGRDPDSNTVVFEKGTLEKILGVKGIRKEELTVRLKRLMSPVNVEVEPNRFKRISLFEETQAEKDEETGLWTVKLTCTMTARHLFFNIENIGYLRYSLKNFVNFTSHYSYVMFMYLVDNRFKREWDVELEKLKYILNCETKTYIDYKIFNNLILKKCQDEIHKKTDLRYEYKPIRNGRKITALKFVITSTSDELAEGAEINFEGGTVDSQPLKDENIKDNVHTDGKFII